MVCDKIAMFDSIGLPDIPAVYAPTHTDVIITWPSASVAGLHTLLEVITIYITSLSL